VKRLILSGTLLMSSAWAHDPITTNLTWSKEISRVVYQHCATCHRPEGRAFSLMTYEDARPWAKAIRDEVLNRRMPPWDAVKGVGEFRDDPSLSLPEMDLIVNWVEGGAPEGNAIYLPSRPKWSTPVDDGPAAGVALNGPMTLTSALTIAGIRPSGAGEITALLPDGQVQRLIWIRKFRPEWNRTYWLRSALRLPAGTKVLLTGAGATLVPAAKR
jgi:hypothetical protein